ncbi:MAG TPA: ABC transporter permease [Firmicutes bacterium]|nr:ABC transporter permease [Candidatus Fermentithermobacillaceae bacterium]
MRAIQIALKDVKTVGRDYKALAIILAMPVILIVILGAALGGMFSGTAMNPIKVAVADLDGGMVSEEFIHVLAHESIVGLIDVVEVRSEDEGTDLLKAGSVAVVVVIPKGVSDAGSPDLLSLRYPSA